MKKMPLFRLPRRSWALLRSGQRFMLLLAIALMPAVAFAQQAQEVPQAALRRSPPIWLGYLVMAVLFAVVVLLSLMPSKRSHQD